MGRGAFSGLWPIVTNPHVVQKDVGLLQTSLRRREIRLVAHTELKSYLLARAVYFPTKRLPH